MPILDNYEPEDRGAEDDYPFDDGDDFCEECGADLGEDGLCSKGCDVHE